MTLPFERLKAVNNTREFLLDLINPSVTPRIPKEVREHARSLLKHYPWNIEMEMVCDIHKMGDNFQPIFSEDMNK